MAFEPHGTALADGDRLAVPGLAVDVRVAVVRPEPGARTGFQLVHARGASFGLSHSPFVVGGAATDDLVVRRWPASAVRLHLVDGELYVEAEHELDGLGEWQTVRRGRAGQVFYHLMQKGEPHDTQ